MDVCADIGAIKALSSRKKGQPATKLEDYVFIVTGRVSKSKFKTTKESESSSTAICHPAMNLEPDEFDTPIKENQEKISIPYIGNKVIHGDMLMVGGQTAQPDPRPLICSYNKVWDFLHNVIHKHEPVGKKGHSATKPELVNDWVNIGVIKILPSNKKGQPATKFVDNVFWKPSRIPGNVDKTTKESERNSLTSHILAVKKGHSATNSACEYEIRTDWNLNMSNSTENCQPAMNLESNSFSTPNKDSLRSIHRNNYMIYMDVVSRPVIRRINYTPRVSYGY